MKPSRRSVYEELISAICPFEYQPRASAGALFLLRYSPFLGYNPSMSKRPKDMTSEEREALPIGPIIRENGRLVHKGTRPIHYHHDDLLVWEDPAGRLWGFGLFADGNWFKRPIRFVDFAPFRLTLHHTQG